MKTFIKKELQLSTQQENTIEIYLRDIEKYIEKNGLEKDLYTDIEERMFEKLFSNTPLTDFKIQQVIHEIGKIEDIFGESDESQKTENSYKEGDKFYKKLQATHWERSNNRAFILGLSSVFAHKFGVSPWVIRLVFSILIFAGGLGFILYCIAGLIIPVVGKNYDDKRVVQYLLLQLRYLLVDITKNIFIAIEKGVPAIAKSVGNIFKNTTSILGFLVYIFLGVGAAIGLAGFIGLAGAYISDFTVENISFVSTVGVNFIWTIVFGIVFFATLATFAGFSVFGKKIYTKYFLLIGTSSFLAFVFLFGVAGIKAFNTYSQNGEIIQSVASTNVGKDELIVLDVNEFETPTLGQEYSVINEVEFFSGTGSELQIDIITSAMGDTQLIDSIKKSSNEYTLLKNDRGYSLRNVSGQLYSQKVPLTYSTRKLNIYIPQDKKIVISGSYNMRVKQIDIKESDYILDTIYGGHNSIMTFQKFYFEDGVLKYDLTEAGEKQVQEGEIEKQLTKISSEVSPIKHSEKYIQDQDLLYKGNETQDDKKEAYWYISPIDFEGKGEDLFIFSDSYISYTAKIRYSYENDLLKIQEVTVQSIDSIDSFNFEMGKYTDSIKKYVTYDKESNTYTGVKLNFDMEASDETGQNKKIEIIQDTGTGKTIETPFGEKDEEDKNDT